MLQRVMCLCTSGDHEGKPGSPDADSRGKCAKTVRRCEVLAAGMPVRELREMSTGMPAGIWLNKFGVIVRDYFGHVPYHVGSSLKTKDWRDVDVRLILPDDEFEALFGQLGNLVNPKFAAITLAFSALAKEMTGLPVDFQIQSQTHANKAYGGETRSALIEVGS